MDRELLRTQCEAYVLGVLDHSERAGLQNLIDRQDPETLLALREATETVAHIAYAAPLADPPPLLRARLLNSLPEHRAPVRRRAWLMPAGWAVAAGLALVAVLARFEAGRSRDELEQARAEIQSLARQAEQSRSVMAILMAPDARMIRLSDARQAPRLRAFWSAPAGIVLAGTDLPAPAAGRTMQLWVVPKQGAPISAGVFQPDDRGQVLYVTRTAALPAQAAALAVSDEPAGGSPQPTTTPVWVGPVGGE